MGNNGESALKRSCDFHGGVWVEVHFLQLHYHMSACHVECKWAFTATCIGLPGKQRPFDHTWYERMIVVSDV